MNESLKTALVLLGNPAALAHLERVRGQIYSPVCHLSAEVAVTKEPVAYEDRLALDYKPIHRGGAWGTLFDCAWFRFFGQLDKGVLQELKENPHNFVGIFDTASEGCIYDDDGVVQGLTNVLHFVDYFQSKRGKKVVSAERLSIDDEGKVLVWDEAGCNGIVGMQIGSVHYHGAYIARFRKDIFDYYYDFWTLYQISREIEPDEAETVKAALKTAKRLYGTGSKEGVAKARAVLAKFFEGGNKTDFEITAVGHAHLDLAWKWPLRETKRKAERTYSNALANIEAYPDYIFGSSQPQQFEWIKDRRPALYQKIKQAVESGRLEPQGCMWCEPDTNVPNGESLIRQCYYGKKFFRDEFNREIDYLWVPDVFGYTASLPRILRGCGVDKFMTIKLSWNTVNKFPHHSFNWKGIGEGEILVHMPPEGDYNSGGTPYATKRIQREYREKAVSKVALMPYGCGDGGGGPGEYQINVLERQSKVAFKNYPRVKLDGAEGFFAKLTEEKEILPSYEGELYLEKHRGTYTTQGRMKKDMRRAEVLLHETEFLSTLAALRGVAYPMTKLDKIWKNVLLHQFHDILPGSSIKRVYDEAHAVFEKQEKVLERLSQNAVRALGDDGENILNATSFERKGYINTENGWKSYSVAPYSTAKLTEIGAVNVSAADTVLENALLKVSFGSNGEIVSLFDKVAGVESVASEFNLMNVYRDKKMIPYDAWDINPDYYTKPPRTMRLVASKAYVEGARAVREQTYRYRNSTLTQKVILENDSPMVRFENRIDWQESHKMLRADFYPSHYGDTVRCDIQMGYLDRTTREDDSVQKAQFEICAHKWVDVTADGYGVAVLNDCKYGYRAKNGLISLNLLRATDFPDKEADRGVHEFAFAVYPHAGEAVESGLIKLGYSLNNPVKPCSAAFDSFVAVDNSAVLVETVAVTENGDVAVRLYESKGASATAALRINMEYTTVRQSDLMFEHATAVEPDKLSFTPFEIKTLLFTPVAPITLE